MKTLLLFLLTAVAEIVGCYLPYLWLRWADGVPLTRCDLVGSAQALGGMAVIMARP